MDASRQNNAGYTEDVIVFFFMVEKTHFKEQTLVLLLSRKLVDISFDCK